MNCLDGQSDHLRLAILLGLLAVAGGSVPALAEPPAAAPGLSAGAALHSNALDESSPLLPATTWSEPPRPVTPDELANQSVYGQDWGCRILPEGLIYRSYLAGPKESRLSTQVVRIPDDSWLWDTTLGARIGLLRIGTSDPVRPRGFEVDVEASAQARLDLLEDMDIRSVDFRVGLPLTWGNDRHQWKFAYYHISSHLVDEFLLKHLTFPRFSQARDTLVLGCSYYLTDPLRVYAEAGWAFHSNASEPWEFQFGLDYAPRGPTGWHGVPFVALNGHLRQELDFGGGFTFQAGWAWRADATARLLRLGLQYYNGASPQYAFLPFHEQEIGCGVWYDF